MGSSWAPLIGPLSVLDSVLMGSSWAPLIGPLSVLDSVLMGSSWAPLIGPLSVLIGINFYGQFLGTTDWSFVCMC